MTTKAFYRAFARAYDVDEQWAKAWIESVMDCVFDQLVDIDVDEVRLPFIGTIKKDYEFPRKRYNINKGIFEECPGHMKLTFAPSGRLARRIRELPQDAELANKAKQQRRDSMMPHKVDLSQNNTTGEVLEDEEIEDDF